jgi:hypothetical protein
MNLIIVQASGKAIAAVPAKISALIMVHCGQSFKFFANHLFNGLG